MTASDDSNAIYAKIDGLDMSPSMKEAMRTVHDHYKGTRCGLPEYDLKGIKIWKVISMWAAIFTIFYYLFKGMWRKALSLLGLLLCIGFVFVGVEVGLDLHIPNLAYSIANTLPVVICLMSAYRDIYRSRVLGQTFWW